MAQVTVKHRFVHQAPRKLRLVGDSVRGLPAERATFELKTVNKFAGDAIRKAILSAMAAAKEKGLNTASLFVSQIMVDEGPKLRRFIPRSRGRSQRILKKMSHITLSLTDEPITIASGKVYKKELQVNTPAPKTAKTTKKAEKATEPVETPATEPVVEVVADNTAEGSK
jgi:large subunit ribosomal protein L22